jgi:hypothetical protein
MVSSICMDSIQIYAANLSIVFDLFNENICERYYIY